MSTQRRKECPSSQEREKERECTHVEGAGERERKSAHTRRGKERERESALAPPFICFFLPLGLPYANWASQECCLFYLKSSLWSSDLPLFYFCGLFPSLSFAAAAAAKSLQSCPTLCDPIDCDPLGSSVPGILQARILEWVAVSFFNA